MKKFNQLVFLACGLLLTLAANSVFAQEEKSVQINKKPIDDFAGQVAEKVRNRKVDLAAPFSIQAEVFLDVNGQFDSRKSKYVKSEGDAEMIVVAKDLVEAIGDSNIFIYLQKLGIKKANLTFSQDETTVRCSVISEFPTAEKAKATASGLNAIFGMAKLQNKSTIVKVLFGNWNIKADKNTLSMSFASSNLEIHDYLADALKQLMEKTTR